jgi:hypothetical protein
MLLERSPEPAPTARRRSYRRYAARMEEIDVEPAPFPSAGAALSPL